MKITPYNETADILANCYPLAALKDLANKLRANVNGKKTKKINWANAIAKRIDTDYVWVVNPEDQHVDRKGMIVNRSWFQEQLYYEVCFGVNIYGYYFVTDLDFIPEEKTEVKVTINRFPAVNQLVDEINDQGHQIVEETKNSIVIDCNKENQQPLLKPYCLFCFTSWDCKDMIIAQRKYFETLEQAQIYKDKTKVIEEKKLKWLAY